MQRRSTVWREHGFRQPVGSTGGHKFDPQYALRDELRALLKNVLSRYPEALRNELLVTKK